MKIALHATSYARLEQRARALELSVGAFCERVLSQLASHQGFCVLVQHASDIDGYKNLFAPGAKVATVSVRNNKPGVSAIHVQNVLTAYALGISHRDDLALRDISLEARLSIFTE